MASYKIGVVTASSKRNLGKKTINHLNLSVKTKTDMHKNIGRKVVHTSGLGFKTIQKIIAVQKMWGHNKHGEYVPNIIGYRIAANKDDFGRCFNPADKKNNIRFLRKNEKFVQLTPEQHYEKMIAIANAEKNSLKKAQLFENAQAFKDIYL